MSFSRPSILQINTHDASGGAGKAAYRLHKGLLSIGQNSKFLAREATGRDPGVFSSPADRRYERHLVSDRLINKYGIGFNRTSLSNTYFSFSYPGYDLTTSPAVADADIINLHWVEDFLSPVSLNGIFHLRKPVVWTLHDQKPFTGGCHYSAGCENHREACSPCPQLQDDPVNLPMAVLRDKRELFQGADLTIVSPSRWLAEEARSSALFSSHRIEVIPNSLETAIYFPADKGAAKTAFGITPDTITILYCTTTGREERKGIKHLVAALARCLSDPAMRGLVQAGRLMIISVGRDNELLQELPLPCLNRGFVRDDREMAVLYNAADLCVIPSLQDNLPNTMIEALACGTPVIAFNVGGIPDVIRSGVNGLLVSCPDDDQLHRAIRELVLDADMRKRMGEAGAADIRLHHTLENQAARYLQLYEDLLSRKPQGASRIARAEHPYGRHTRKIHPDLFRLAVQKTLAVRFNVELRNRTALKLMSRFVFALTRVLPNKLFMKLKDHVV
jgi:glycosyltransferase involved in cell wall biosynthesis